ncbi:MAG: hypothetical protein CYPHOPRED_004786 [Cyphobasidiales sp. Tagirdzhanova-0007]|nr:MAG: hypothetical protein CYPHOPRED_004786 [Cyphobasidiales sp. Tagirdzhanova-0007]
MSIITSPMAPPPPRSDSGSLPELTSSPDSDDESSSAHSILDISIASSESGSLKSSDPSGSLSPSKHVHLVEPIRSARTRPCPFQKAGSDSLDSVRSVLHLAPVARSSSFTSSSSSFCDGPIRSPRLHLRLCPLNTRESSPPSEDNEPAQPGKTKMARRLSNALFHPRKARRATIETSEAPWVEGPQTASPLSSPPLSPISPSSPHQSVFAKHFPTPPTSKRPRTPRRAASDETSSASGSACSGFTSSSTASTLPTLPSPPQYGAYDRHRTMSMVRQQREAMSLAAPEPANRRAFVDLSGQSALPIDSHFPGMLQTRVQLK